MGQKANHLHRRLRGSLGATLNREIGFVSSSFSFRAWRASGRGEAASACEMQSVPPGPALAVGSSSTVRGLFEKLRTWCILGF